MRRRALLSWQLLHLKGMSNAERPIRKSRWLPSVLRDPAEISTKAQQASAALYDSPANTLKQTGK